MVYIFFVIGLAALFLGGEYLVRGAASIAQRFNLSPMVIGLTIVGFGTSAPELLVSIQAATSGQPAIAVGNVLGSNVANILLILGVSACVGTLSICIRDNWRDIAFLIASTALLWLTLIDESISQFEGFILFLGLTLFMGTALFYGKNKEYDEDSSEKKAHILLSLFHTIGGLLVLVYGAHLLIENATIIARQFGVSEAAIALTIVAIGTSLPELATGLIATLRGRTDIAIGNIIGSNIFNVFSILGITALITPIPVDSRFPTTDMLWVAGATIALVSFSAVFRRIPRRIGPMLLAAYGVYVMLVLT